MHQRLVASLIGRVRTLLRLARRFQVDAMKVLDLDLRTSVNILTRVYSNAPFVASIAKKSSVMFLDLLFRMQKYVRLESTLEAAASYNDPLTRVRRAVR